MEKLRPAKKNILRFLLNKLLKVKITIANTNLFAFG